MTEYKPKKLYTIGHNGHGGVNGLIEVLKENQIEMVIDVRRRAWSAHPGYRKESLKSTLSNNRIGYVHVPEVGPSVELLDWWKKIAAPTNWKEYQSRYFNSEVDMHIESLAEFIIESDKVCCLLCAENDYTMCHRSLIANALFGIIGLNEVIPL